MSCSSDEHSEKECPLCMELLEIDDVDFYPCKCEYQICRFCWHRLRTDENGLCPACRQPYPEDPVNFKPLSSADFVRIKDEKKLKQQAERLRISESRKHLANYRVLQKNLVYVVGLSQRVATEEVLKKPEYFGRFGKILKVVTGMTPVSNLPHIQPSHTAYVTFSKVDEALRAIQGVNNAQLDGRTVKASLGTTKYCSSYLRTQTCGKPECMYLHDIAEKDLSFTKDDMHMGKHTDYEKRLIETILNKRDQLDRRPINKNVCWDHNGRTLNEEPTIGVCSAISEPEAVLDLDDPTPSEALALEKERQNSQDKENLQRLSKPSTSKQKPLAKLRERSTSPIRTASISPPTTEHEPLESATDDGSPSLDLDFTKYAPATLSTLSYDLPPHISDVNGPAHPHSNGLLSRQSNLLRFMQSATEEDSLRGSIPALAAPIEEAPAPLTNWQSLLGLVPHQPPIGSTVGVNSVARPKRLSSPGLSGLFSDDDLGFDPFSESTKGLAKLLEEERVRHHQPVSSTIRHMPLPNSHVPLEDLWSRPSANPFSQSSHHKPAQMSSPFDLFGMSQLSSGFPNGMNFGMSDYTEPSNQRQVPQQNSFVPPPPPPGLSAPRRTNVNAQPQSMMEWQEGLKALLPNVNVRFASDMDTQQQQHHHHHSVHHHHQQPQQQQPAQLPRWQQSFSHPHTHSHHQLLSHPIPPPPGFSVPNR